ncbi:cell envelope biogenesis protein TolA [Parasphingorhabdus sp.]|uniref:cell envelope biogenesis protein TolA n=1 Tax=Parasphingorhabdus sp. TaxID=2709688 RepID=UPI003263F256
MERAEKIGLGVAAAGHIALFGVLSFSFFGGTDDSFKPKPIEVMIADEVGLESSAPNPSLVPPATSVAPELGTPDPAELVEPDVAPLPELPDVKPTPPREKPAAKPKAPPKPTPKPKEKPKGSRLGKDFLKGVTDAPSTSRNQNIAAEKASPAAVASLNREVTRQLKPHWQRLAPSGADAELLRTTIIFNLNPDGSLSGPPNVIRTSGATPSNRPQVALHAERAVAAIRRAAPFRLPEKFYAEWKSIRYDFDKSLSR